MTFLLPPGIKGLKDLSLGQFWGAPTHEDIIELALKRLVAT